MSTSSFAPAALIAAYLIAVLAGAGSERSAQALDPVAKAQSHVCVAPTGPHGTTYCSGRRRHFVCQCFRDICRWGQTYRTC